MDASGHLVVGNIYWHSFYIADFVYGILGKYCDEACLAHESQQRVDLIQFYSYFEIIVIRHYAIKCIAGL